MRASLVLLLAAALGIFLLGLVSGMALERSLEFNRINQSALCRQAQERRRGIRVTALDQLKDPELQAEIRQIHEEIERFCLEGPDALGSPPSST